MALEQEKLISDDYSARYSVTGPVFLRREIVCEKQKIEKLETKVAIMESEITRLVNWMEVIRETGKGSWAREYARRALTGGVVSRPRQ